MIAPVERWRTGLRPNERKKDAGPANLTFPRLVAAAARRRELVRELVALRTSRGLSQTAVAARMSTSQPVMARLEAGDLGSRISTLERYADAVGVELEMRLTERGASCT